MLGQMLRLITPDLPVCENFVCSVPTEKYFYKYSETPRLAYPHIAADATVHTCFLTCLCSCRNRNLREPTKHPEENCNLLGTI